MIAETPQKLKITRFDKHLKPHQNHTNLCSLGKKIIIIMQTKFDREILLSKQDYAGTQYSEGNTLKSQFDPTTINWTKQSQVTK